MSSASGGAPFPPSGRRPHRGAILRLLLSALVVAAALVTAAASDVLAAECPTGKYLAEYFGNKELEGAPVATGCEERIDYTWWSRGPGGGMGTEHFSARWTGRHTFASGTYRFSARADDGVRVWLDGQLLIDQWRSQQPATHSVSRAVGAGDHEVKVEYFEAEGDAEVHVTWQSTPGPAATASPSPSPSPSPTASPSPSPSPTASPSPSPSPTASPSPSPSPTTSPTISAPPPTGSGSGRYRDAVLATAGLVGYWRLGETGGTLVADGSGQGRHGAAGGGVTRGVPGALSGEGDAAFGFDGASGYVRVPDAAAAVAGGSVSLEGWIWPRSRPAQHHGYFGLRNDSSVDFYVLQLQGTDTIEARFRGAWGVATTLTAPVTPDRWQHVAVTYNAPKQLLQLYVDGRLRASTYGPGGRIEAGAVPLEIGRLSAGNGAGAHYAAGRVDEVALYRSVLRAGAILDRVDAAAGVTRARLGVDGSGPRWAGAYVAGSPGNPARLDEFAAAVGAAPAVAMWYQDWQHGGFNFDQMDLAVSRGAVPMVTWMPTGDAPADYALARINSGAHDDFVRRWARDAAAWGQPFFLRFAHEMNGTWYPWSPGVNGNTAADYVAAWRRVHGIFREEGAGNALWVWSPNVDAGPGLTPTPIPPLFPGDAYVDWLALDGYNWGDGQPWHPFGSLFGPSYRTVTALSGKPLLIGETASGEGGGDKAAWIGDAYLGAILRDFPRLRGVVWFNERKERDWRVDSSAASLAAYREAVAGLR